VPADLPVPTDPAAPAPVPEPPVAPAQDPATSMPESLGNGTATDAPVDGVAPAPEDPAAPAAPAV
jgi:hypothetical protein